MKKIALLIFILSLKIFLNAQEIEIESTPVETIEDEKK